MRILGNNVLVEKIPGAWRSRGDIIIPETARESLDYADAGLFRVVQVGPGMLTRKGKLIPIECAPGDRVLCHSYTKGPEILGGTQRIVAADTILCVFPKD